MVRVDLFVYGYRRIKVSPDMLSDATSLLLRASVISVISSDSSLIVRERDMDKLRSAFHGKIEYEESDLLGLPGAYKRVEHKHAIISAAILSLLIAVFLSSVVWDIRIDGNVDVPDEAVELALSECGFDIGDLWLLKDRSRIENEVLIRYPSIAWININRRGTVAYVTVSETSSDGNESAHIDQGYANIVADVDCVIEEITVTRGVAVVKKGDSVRRGDILIAGIVSSESDGILCHAEGTVIGRVSDTVSVEVAREHVERIKGERELISLQIKIFNFSLNIFKRYRNLSSGCDIIEDVKVFSLFGKHNLPISLISEYAVDYEISDALYDDSALVSLASSRLSAQTASRLLLSDLIRMRTYGEYTDRGYRMSADLVFLTDVGRELPFLAD